MKNFLQEGDIAVVPAPSPGVASGDFVLVGALFGVAQIDAVTGADCPIVREGVFTLPKATGTAWTKGDALYWDAGAGKFTKTATGNKPFGVAFADAASGDATGAVSIEAVQEGVGTNPISGTSAGKKFVGGQITTASAADTVVTGLTTVIACGATYDDNPGDANDFVSATIGDQAGTPAAGSIIVKTWKSADGADVTPVAATAFSKKVNWWAYGA